MTGRGAQTEGFDIKAFLRRHALLPVLAGLFLAILAPLGTHSFSLVGRLVFWIGMTLAGGFGAMLVRAVIATRWPDTGRLSNVLAMSIGATLAVSPFVLTIYSTQTFGSVLLTLFYIWIISAAISAVGALSDRSTQATGGNSAVAVRPPLIERLPPKLRDATLYAITSEDHYVRIFTDRGDHLHLMRLSDAEDLAHPVPGLKPHRSWWVAEAGVEQVHRAEGKLSITLKNGMVVPVSRSGAKTVKAANWI